MFNRIIKAAATGSAPTTDPSAGLAALRRQLVNRQADATAAYAAALKRLTAAKPGAEADAAATDLLAAASAAGVPAVQVERDAAAGTAAVAPRPPAQRPRSYLMPSMNACMLPLPDADGRRDWLPCQYIRPGLTGTASPPTLLRTDGFDWQPTPGVQTVEDVRDLLLVVAWYLARLPGKHPAAMAVARREVGGLFRGSAAEVVAGRPAWRIMLASCEANVLTKLAGKSAAPRRDTFLLRLGRGDLVETVQTGG